MASACAINTATGVGAGEDLLWPSPTPRLSFSRDFSSESQDQPQPHPHSDVPDPSTSPSPKPPSASASASDFEFHLHQPASIIPADELFSNGKLVPLQTNTSSEPDPDPDQQTPSSDPDPDPDPPAMEVGHSTDPLAPSPRAPMCTSRWKDLLRLKRAKAAPLPCPSKKTLASISNQQNNSKNPRPPLRFLLRKNNSIPKSPSEQSMSSPLLPSASASASASASDLEEKLDSPSASRPPKIRLVRPVPPEEPNSDSDPVRANRVTAHQASNQAGQGQGGRTGPSPSVDSPRLNAAGKVVFTGALERSSSSPGCVTGGPRLKYRGIERSYSANVNGVGVRIAPVLNVPVCSLRGSRKSVSVFGFERIFKGVERRERGGLASSVGGRAGATTVANKGKSEAE